MSDRPHWSPLDEARHNAQVVMRREADVAVSKVRSVIDRAYSTGAAALAACRTEAEVERIERGFIDAMKTLRGITPTGVTDASDI